MLPKPAHDFYQHRSTIHVAAMPPRKKTPKAPVHDDPDDIIDLNSVAIASTEDEYEKKAARSFRDVEKMARRIEKRVDCHDRWCPLIHRSKQLRSL